MALIGRFGPPLGLMGLIFFLSAQPDLSSGLGTIDTIGRKAVHMTEFGLLWFLWWRALDRRHPLAAALIAVAYAVSDELHQTQVEGRNGTPLDVAIDAAGVAVAWLAARSREARPGS